MNSVEEEHQARRAKDKAQHHIDNPNHHHHPLLQNIPLAPVWNRGRGRFQPAPVHIPLNLELNLYRHQHNEQQQLQIIGGDTSTLHYLHLLSIEQQQRITQEYRSRETETGGREMVEATESSRTVGSGTSSKKS